MDYSTGDYKRSLCETVSDWFHDFWFRVYYSLRGFWRYTILGLPRPTLAELISKSLEKHTPALVANVTTANALLKRLGEKPVRRKVKGRKPNRRKAT